MTRRVQNAGLVATPVKCVALFDEILNTHHGGSCDTEPLRLFVEILVRAEIGLVDQDRSTSRSMKPGKTTDVINMSVCADDGANFQSVAVNDFENALDLVARVHDDRFARS